MQYKAIIFDLDGTLLDTLEDIAGSMNQVLERHGFPVHTADSYRELVGDGVGILVERSLPPEKRGNEELIALLTTQMRDVYATRWDRCTRPYPGIPALLEELHRRRFQASVLSNKPDHFTRMIVSQLLPQFAFRSVAGSKPTVPIEPDPGAALEMAKEMNVSPAECLYVGDTNTDMKTALNAGMFPAGVLWGFRGREELLASGAKTLLEKPAEILDYL